MRQLFFAVGTVVLAACGSWPARSDATAEAPPRCEDPAPSGPAHLRRYKEAHYRELGDRFVEALDTEALLEEIAASRVLYLGDHHADDVLHDAMLELLDRVADERGIVLGLEAIGTDDGDDVRAFLAGGFDLAELRQRVAARWPESWLVHPGLDAPFYNRLLRFAVERSCAVFALEPTPRLGLAHRDGVIAASISRALEDYSDRLVVVVLGHAHLLGLGDVVDRVGAAATVVGARLSVTLATAYRELAPAAIGFLRSNAGVYFFNPPPGLEATVEQDVTSAAAMR